MEKETKPNANKEIFNGFDDDILNPDDFKDPEDKEKEKSKDKEKSGDDKSKQNPENKDLDKSKDKEKEKENPENTPDKDKDKEKQKPDEEKELEKKNAYYAELRRKKEAEEKAKLQREREDRDKQIREQATVEGKLSVLKTNPYTEEPIVDEEDLKTYEIMRELEKEGRDPVKDYAKEVANRNRIARAKASELEKSKRDEEAKQQERAKKEVEVFSKLHPEVDLGKLAADADFQKFAGDKFGRWTLDEIYSAYSKTYQKKTDEDNDKEKELAKKQTKTPNPNSGKQELEKNYEDMTDEEYREQAKKKANQDDFF